MRSIFRQRVVPGCVCVRELPDVQLCLGDIRKSKLSIFYKVESGNPPQPRGPLLDDSEAPVDGTGQSNPEFTR